MGENIKNKQIQTQEKGGFTSYHMKLIALFFMVLDHIYKYFSFTGKIPIAFTWLGRISAPLFIFMTVEGYYHTSDFKKYAKRLYSASVFMGVGNLVVNHIFARPDNVILIHSMFTTMLLLVIHLKIWDSLDEAVEKKENMKVFARLTLLFLPTAISLLLLTLIPKMPEAVASMVILLIPNVFLTEGGLVFITTGIILYIFRENRFLQMLIYAALSFTLMPKLSSGSSVIFYQSYQWMMVLAIPFMFFYNGEKGKDNKPLFYLFYPLHIYALYIISSLLMR